MADDQREAAVINQLDPIFFLHWNVEGQPSTHSPNNSDTSSCMLESVSSILSQIPQHSFVDSLHNEISRLLQIADETNHILVQKVRARYNEFVSGATKIYEIERELKAIRTLVEHSRSQLLRYDSQFVVNSLVVSQLQLRSKRLCEVLTFLKDIQRFFVYDFLSSNFISTGRLQETILLVTDALIPLKSDERYVKFTSVVQLTRRLTRLLNTVRQRLHAILKEFAWTPSTSELNFDKYMQALKAFCLMPQSQSIGAEMVRHLGEYSFFETHRNLRTICIESGVEEEGDVNTRTATLAELAEKLPHSSILNVICQLFRVQYETMGKISSLWKWHMETSKAIKAHRDIEDESMSKAGKFHSKMRNTADNVYDLQKYIEQKAKHVPSEQLFADYLKKVGAEIEAGKDNVWMRLQQTLISVLFSVRIDSPNVRYEDGLLFMKLVYAFAESTKYFLDPFTLSNASNPLESVGPAKNVEGEKKPEDSQIASSASQNISVPYDSLFFNCAEARLIAFIASHHLEGMYNLKRLGDLESWERVAVDSTAELLQLLPIDNVLEEKFGELLHGNAGENKQSFPLEQNPFDNISSFKAAFKPLAMKTEENDTINTTLSWNTAYFEVLKGLTSEDDAAAKTLIDSYASSKMQSGVRCHITEELGKLLESYWNTFRLLPRLATYALDAMIQLVDFYFYIVANKMIDAQELYNLTEALSVGTELLSGNRLYAKHEQHLLQQSYPTLRRVLTGLRNALLLKEAECRENVDDSLAADIKALLRIPPLPKTQKQDNLYGCVERIMAFESITTMLQMLEQSFLEFKNGTNSLEGMEAHEVKKLEEEEGVEVRWSLGKYLTEVDKGQLIEIIHTRWLALNEAKIMAYMNVASHLVNSELLLELSSSVKWDAKVIDASPNNAAILFASEMMDAFPMKLCLASSGAVPNRCLKEFWGIVLKRLSQLGVEMLGRVKKLPANGLDGVDNHALLVFKTDVEKLMNPCKRQLEYCSRQELVANAFHKVDNSKEYHDMGKIVEIFEIYWGAHLIGTEKLMEWNKVQDTYSVRWIASLFHKFEARKKIPKGSVADVEALYGRYLKGLYGSSNDSTDSSFSTYVFSSKTGTASKKGN